MHTRRTQPALPGAMVATAPGAGFPAYDSALSSARVPLRRHYARRAIILLLVLALFLEIFTLALYPLFAATTSPNDAVKQGLLSVFPWLPYLYWTNLFPLLTQLLAHVPQISPLNSMGNANLLLALLTLTFALVVLASRVGSRATRVMISRAGIRAIFWIVMAFTLLFGVTYFLAPALVSRDVFLYDFYARAAVLYHLNPYTLSPDVFAHDPLRNIVLNSVHEAVPYGPVWLDLSIPVVFFAHDSLVNILLGFRLFGLVVHLANALLIWVILAKVRPGARISGTLLYAWNPAVLLLGVSEMHRDLVVIFCVLLAALLFQRNALILSWVLLLLAALINAFCLLLLPLFLHLLWREVRVLRWGQRFFWWMGLIIMTALVVALAFAPYWQGAGWIGLLESIRAVFWQGTATNSLDSALLHLPLTLPPAIVWLAAPHHWLLFAAAAVAVQLLVGAWLPDTLGMVLFFGGWLFLALLALLPASWPWFALLPLALAICAANPRTLLLAMLLGFSSLLCYYFLLWQPPWSGMALLTIGLPLIVWGWILFFTSTWQMTRPGEPPSQPGTRAKQIPRTSWPSRPSRAWSSRPSRPFSQGRRT